MVQPSRRRALPLADRAACRSARSRRAHTARTVETKALHVKASRGDAERLALIVPGRASTVGTARRLEDTRHRQLLPSCRLHDCGGFRGDLARACSSDLRERARFDLCQRDCARRTMLGTKGKSDTPAIICQMTRLIWAASGTFRSQRIRAASRLFTAPLSGSWRVTARHLLIGFRLDAPPSILCCSSNSRRAVALSRQGSAATGHDGDRTYICSHCMAFEARNFILWRIEVLNSLNNSALLLRVAAARTPLPVAVRALQEEDRDARCNSPVSR